MARPTPDPPPDVALSSPTGFTITHMHPLDAASLEGFEIVATSELVVRREHAEVWSRLAVDNEEPTDLGDLTEHRVIERFDPGEHRCSTIRPVSGRTVCTRGFRRLLAHGEILEVEYAPGGDRLLRTTFLPLRWGRTHIASYVGVRPHEPRLAEMNAPVVDMGAFSGGDWGTWLREGQRAQLLRLGG